jgi:hypothetical protein
VVLAHTHAVDGPLKVGLIHRRAVAAAAYLSRLWF